MDDVCPSRPSARLETRLRDGPRDQLVPCLLRHGLPGEPLGGGVQVDVGDARHAPAVDPGSAWQVSMRTVGDVRPVPPTHRHEHHVVRHGHAVGSCVDGPQRHVDLPFRPDALGCREYRLGHLVVRDLCVHAHVLLPSRMSGTLPVPRSSYLGHRLPCRIFARVQHGVQRRRRLAADSVDGGDLLDGGARHVGDRPEAVDERGRARG